MTKRKASEPILDLDDVRTRLLAVEKQLNDTFVQRTEAIRVILLGVLAQVNYIFIGDPGTAKSSVIDRFTMHVSGGKRFKIQMGKFIQPDDVFGPLDIEAFKRGQRKVVTDNMMPDSPYPILDEALKASDGCINSLLEIMQERTFRSEPTQVLCAGAATNWPEVDQLSKHVEALYDRFLLRCHVTPVDRSKKTLRRELYRAATKVRTYQPNVTVTVDELKAAHADALDVEVSDEVIDILDGIVGRLMGGKDNYVEVSDRRSTALQVVLQANAWLEGRDEVSIEDFDVLKHGLWSKRKDLEHVKAVLETVDAQAVQEIVDMADRGRGAYRQLQTQGFGVAKVNEVTDEIKKIAYEVQQRLKRPVYTKQGRLKIKKAMAALREDFEDLNQRAQASAGKVR